MVATGTQTNSTAHDQAPWLDFVHTGPGTLAGRWLRTFWQPVYRSQDLAPGRSMPIRIMNEDLTLYRGESGDVHLLAFRCAHRGTQLSTGWVEGDDLRCFYHGWKYNGSGQCIEQPAEPEPFCDKIRIRSYPIQDYLGVLFAYLGDGEPPELMRFPEFEDENRGILDILYSTSPCNYFNLIDNDPTHIYFVHKTFNQAQGRAPDIPVLDCEETDYGFVTKATDSAGSWVYFSHMPNMVHGRRDGYPKGEAIQWRVPIDDENSLSVGITLIYLKGEEAEKYRAQRVGRSRSPELAKRVNELGDSVLRGEIRVHDLDDRSVLFNVQDYVSQVGLGRMVDIEPQHLGREDVPTIMLRKLFSREMRALAEGRPLKQWMRPKERMSLGNEDAMLVRP
ncbi:MAG TPA: aromatic ring-hydroxylating dioxygenase subunit alpha [Chloroflexota bacterium]